METLIGIRGNYDRLGVEYAPFYTSNEGSRGDEGADGFSFPQRAVYQIWCPKHLDDFQNKARTKITDDTRKIPVFEARFPGSFAKWVFVTSRDLDNQTLAHLKKKAEEHGLEGLSISQNDLISWLLHSPDIAEQFVPWPTSTDALNRESILVESKFAEVDKWRGIRGSPLLCCIAVPTRQIEIPFKKLDSIAQAAFRSPSLIGEYDERVLPSRGPTGLFYSAGHEDLGTFRGWQLLESGLFTCATTAIIASRAPIFYEHRMNYVTFLAVEKLVKLLLQIADYLQALKQNLAGLDISTPGFNVTVRVSRMRRQALEGMKLNPNRIRAGNHKAGGLQN